MNTLSQTLPLFILVYLLLLLIFVLVLIVMSLAKRLDRERLLNQAQIEEMKRYKLAVSNASDHIVITDPNGIVLYGNKAVEEVTGYRLEEVVGNKAGKMWGGRMPKEYYDKMWHTLVHDKKSFFGEVQNRRKNGQFYDAQVSIVPVMDDNSHLQFFVGVEHDVTKEKELNQAKSDFLSIASHQLRTPLTVAKGYLSLLLEGQFGKIPKKQREQLVKVYESNEKLIDLVQDLLSVSRIESGKMIFDMKSIAIEPIIDNVITELKNLAKDKKIYLKYSKPKNKLPLINGDSDKLRQVIMNLVENCIKYTVAGGVSVSVEADSNQIKFSVSDTGMGISLVDMPNIFQKYARGTQLSTKAVGGTGLGLYVCKVIIDNHLGKIWAESEGEGKGSRFYFTLPLAK